MSHDPIFVTKNGNPSRHQYLGKAGCEAYLKAIASYDGPWLGKLQKRQSIL
jgi:hypothetical protein